MVGVVPTHAAALAVILAVLLTGCSPEEAAGKNTPSIAEGSPSGIAARCTAAPRPQTPKPQTPKPQPAKPQSAKPQPQHETPEEAIARIRRRCHSILERDGMANCSVLLRENESDEVPEDVKLGANDCMSVTQLDRTKKVLTESGAGLHVIPGKEKAFEPIEGAARAELQRFQRLLRAARLQPLYECEKAERKGPETFALTTMRGENWTLTLHEVNPPEAEPVLLPHTLSGPPGKVTFREHLHTGATHLPKRFVLGEFGARWFSLELSAISFNTAVFQGPSEKKAEPRTVRIESGGFMLEPSIGEVGLKPVTAKSALVVPDPGTWKERFAVLKENGRRLAKQGQQTADLDFLFDENGKRFFAMPFEQASEEFGGKPFVKAKDQRVLQLPEQRVAIVYPKNGPLDKNEKIARAQLDAFLQENALRATGPMRITPTVSPNHGCMGA